MDDSELGYDIPARIGMPEGEIQTPCLVLDLDALERNLTIMRDRVAGMGVRLRAHGKMHKSVDVALLQQRIGGSVGLCCQKVSEAEAFARGGLSDLLITNQVRDPLKIDRLARLSSRGARIICCVDDAANLPDLAAAARRHRTGIECLVEIECGGLRCGVETPAEAVAVAQAIATTEGLRFAGVQAYHGTLQHLQTHAERAEEMAKVVDIARATVAALGDAGLTCDIIGGGGTGSFEFEGQSGVFNEVQCGSYAFLDADYGAILDGQGQRLDRGAWHNALFVLTSVMSTARPGMAVVDAGLKSLSRESGLPVVFGRDDIHYIQCSDEHGVLRDPGGVLRINERLRLVPGHCDPTCNLHDWYVGVRRGKVETLWPVSARGKSF